MYEKMPSAAELEAAGLTPEDYEDDYFEVWPENHAAFNLFASLRTQWQTGGMGGVMGLRYEALYPLLDRRCKTEDEWDEMFEDIQVMELEALRVMNAKGN